MSDTDIVLLVPIADTDYTTCGRLERKLQWCVCLCMCVCNYVRNVCMYMYV